MANPMTRATFVASCKAAYDNHMSILANHAISFLNEFFFNRLSHLAQCADDKDIVIPYTQVEGYLKKAEEKNRALKVNWPLDDLVRQVMFFIAAELQGAEYLYANNSETQCASVFVRNPLYPEKVEEGTDVAGLFYKITISNQKVDDDRELPVITVNMHAALPTGFYDPMHPYKKGKKESLPASNL